MEKENRRKNKPVLEKAGTKSLEEVLKVIRMVQKEIETKDYQNKVDPNVRVFIIPNLLR